MSVESNTVASLKERLSKFSGIISRGFKKPKRRLIKEMVYGIQASKDVKLSNISRTLKEDQRLIVVRPICQVKYEKRGQPPL